MIKRKKTVIILVNLLLGNFSLWLFKVMRGQQEFSIIFELGFSLAAVALLVLAFKFIKPGVSTFKLITVASVTSFLAPVFGLSLAFAYPYSLNGLIFGSVLGVLSWPLALPMAILNSALFFWLVNSKH